MSAPLRWSRRAVRDWRDLDATMRRRITEALDGLAEEGHGDVERIQAASPAAYRLLVGRFRVRFAFDPDTGAIEIERVLHRREAYR